MHNNTTTNHAQQSDYCEYQKCLERVTMTMTTTDCRWCLLSSVSCLLSVRVMDPTCIYFTYRQNIYSILVARLTADGILLLFARRDVRFYCHFVDGSATSSVFSIWGWVLRLKLRSKININKKESPHILLLPLQLAILSIICTSNLR